MATALLIDEGAIQILCRATMSNEWFADFEIPAEDVSLRRVLLGSFAYVLSRGASDRSRVLVVDLSTVNLEEHKYAPELFSRIITVALSEFEHAVRVPKNWKPYHFGSKFSCYGTPWHVEGIERIYFERRPDDTTNLFCYALTEEVEDFEDVQIKLPIFRAIYNQFVDALLAPGPVPRDTGDVSQHGIVLRDRISDEFTPGESLEHWYNNKLTREQRDFVDRPLNKSVRLRGSAGTGKTLALTIKFIRDFVEQRKTTPHFRFLFLTHSFATVHRTREIVDALDANFVIASAKVDARIGTLYELASDLLSYDLHDLTPISMDGYEGKRIQYETLRAVLESKKAELLIRFKGDLSKVFYEGICHVGQTGNENFIRILLNEISSVLDAENIRQGTPRARRYVKQKRPTWMQDFNEADRNAILFIHDWYRRFLREMETISLDQMIADFQNYLETNQWDAIRGRAGFDAIFVDELHLFNKQERMTFHNLSRPSEGPPVLFMAYDLKQSTTDTFSPSVDADSGHALFGSGSGFENTELVELHSVFRYTPEIAGFLEDLDACFPAIDLPGEWGRFAVRAEIAGGACPTLVESRNDLSLYNSAFPEASAEVAKYKNGKAVAVLCVSEEMFERYLSAGNHRERFLAIASREEVPELRYAGRRFIFSMPEYVAGLQFETVFMLHADEFETRPIENTISLRRQMISRVYLGASRAKSKLKFFSSIERGGKSSMFDVALRNGSLELVS